MQVLGMYHTSDSKVCPPTHPNKRSRVKKKPWKLFLRTLKKTNVEITEEKRTPGGMLDCNPKCSLRIGVGGGERGMGLMEVQGVSSRWPVQSNGRWLQKRLKGEEHWKDKLWGVNVRQEQRSGGWLRRQWRKGGAEIEIGFTLLVRL